jgi:transcriptional regulator with XRE-family HTH domain
MTAISHTTQVRQVLAKNIKRYRTERGWSQEDLALEAELHRTFVAHVESCRRNISLDNIQKIASALGVTVAELFTE